MALFPGSLDYSDKDFDAIKQRIENIIRGDPALFPDWTDFEIGSFGNTVIEMFCYVLDILSKYQDNQAGEAFVATAQQRKSLIALGKLIGFVPLGRKAATVDLLISLPSVPANDVVFDEGTIAQTSGAGPRIEFRTLAEAQIDAGQDPPEVIVSGENSQDNTQDFVSNQLANQEFSLTTTPFVEITSFVADNGIFTEVDNFLRSRSDDRHFVVITDASDRASVRVGNGSSGELPQGGITIDYSTGGGSEGNVGPGTINSLMGPFTDIAANPVFPQVINDLAADAGDDRQGNESIRVSIPESLRVLTRTVAREDYEIAATKKTSAVRALMLTSDQDPSIAENSGFLFIIPTGGGVPSQALKDEIASIFETRFEEGGLPKTITFKLTVADPVYLPINVFAVVYLESEAVASIVDDTIRTDLETYFAITNVDGSPNTAIDFGFGLKNAAGLPAGELPLSNVGDVITGATGVRKLDDGLTGFTLNGEHQDVPLGLRDFPELGTVTLINGDTGDDLVP